MLKCNIGHNNGKIANLNKSRKMGGGVEVGGKKF